MSRNLPKHEIGSGNVFADTGRPDAELHLSSTASTMSGGSVG